MRGKREHPFLILPLAGALVTYATGRQDWILPLVVFALLVLAYWVPSPSWFGNRRGFAALLFLSLGLSYAYQHWFLEKIVKQIPAEYASTSLIYLDPRILVSLSVLNTLLLLFLWYLPPIKIRKGALLAATMSLVSLNGNTMALQEITYQLNQFAVSLVSLNSQTAVAFEALTQAAKKASQAVYYLPSLGLYFFTLLIYFQFEQRREYKPSRLLHFGYREKVLEFFYVFIFIFISIIGTGFFAVGLRNSAKGMEYFASEVVRLTGGRTRLYFDQSMKLGSAFNFDNSSEPLFNIEGQGPVSEYLRCQVFTLYEKSSWKQVGETPQPLKPAATVPSIAPGQWYAIGEDTTTPAKPWNYRVHLAASLGKIAPSFYGTTRAKSPNPLLYDPLTGLLSFSTDDIPYQYDLEGGMDQPIPGTPKTIEQALFISDDLRSALLPKAMEITKGLNTDQEKAMAVARYFQDFEYSLEARMKAGADPVVDFVLNRRKGYCQFFASGAALLLRSAGVPARVVTGFLIREPVQSEKKSWIICRRDAHAWCEFYDRQQRKWVQIEPTPVSSMNDALGIEKRGYPSKFLDWTRLNLRFLVDSIRRLNFSSIRSLQTRSLILAIAILLGLTGAGMVIRWRKKLFPKLSGFRKRFAPAEKTLQKDQSVVKGRYQLFLGKLEKMGIPVKDSETSEEILGRVKQIIPDQQVYLQCLEFTNRYALVRFRATPEKELEQFLSRSNEILNCPSFAPKEYRH